MRYTFKCEDTEPDEGTTTDVIMVVNSPDENGVTHDTIVRKFVSFLLTTGYHFDPEIYLGKK